MKIHTPERLSPNMDATATLLLDMGITPNLKGFDFTRTAVALLNTDEDKYRNLSQSLYPTIALKYNSTTAGVERAIRHAIQKAIKLDHGEMKILIGLSPYKNNVSNSEFLYSVARRATEEKQENRK